MNNFQSILLIDNISRNIITFRKPLIKYLLKKGIKVFVIVADSKRKRDLDDLGVISFVCEMNNRSLNPFSGICYKNKLTRIIKRIEPDIVFTFQLYPNIFGVKAAKKAGCTRIYSMVEGAGDVFAKNGIKWKLIRFFVKSLYKVSFKFCSKVFFLNKDDRKEFVGLNLLEPEQTVLINGMGVDLEYFSFRPIKEKTNFLMVARMFKTKGTLDFCKCARLVKQEHPEAVFNYIGDDGDLTIEDIQEYIRDGSINYLGTTQDVRPFIEDCFIFILPSCYREGLPMSIMEAQAVGRAVITTLNVGCKDTVVEWVNGFLIEKHDIKSLVAKCCYALEHPDEMVSFGCNARKFAEEKWDSQIISKQIYSVINDVD